MTDPLTAVVDLSAHTLIITSCSQQAGQVRTGLSVVSRAFSSLADNHALMIQNGFCDLKQKTVNCAMHCRSGFTFTETSEGDTE